MHKIATALLDTATVRFLDLTPQLRDMGAARASQVFLTDDGHYSATGNRWAAGLIYEGIEDLLRRGG